MDEQQLSYQGPPTHPTFDYCNEPELHVDESTILSMYSAGYGCKVETVSRQLDMKYYSSLNVQ